ncbi:MFS transporter [Ferroplasma acidarmanus]|uniref:Transporter n=1 Tax=Ferroplasma acidarmanus Fer1 TaxID=333146 RepID=S0AQ91_FERAC|nr:MFS transporter [Ferroplasma acidarmanus]AGO60339.1 transporter [Ferroplasma acidarmanus Fer1]
MSNKTYMENIEKGDIARIVALMAFAGTLIVYVETMIVPAIPVFITFFNTTYNNVSWILTAYLITGTVAAGIFGKLGDVFGKRKVFLILSLIYAISVSMGGFATSLDELIVIRIIQGIGFGMYPLAYAIINDVVPRSRLALAQGLMSATFAVGAGMALVIGAYITEAYSWQWSYHAIAPVAFALFILSYFFLKDNTAPAKEKIDFAGVAIMASGLVMLIFGLSEGNTYGWLSPLILFSFVFSIAAFYAFIKYELASRYAFIDMHLLKSRNILIANFVGLLTMAGMYFLFFTVPTLLQDPAPSGFGKSIFTSGLIMLPATILAMVFAPVAARVTDARGPKISILIGLSVSFIAFILLILDRSTILDIIEAATVLGTGFSFVLVGIINLLLISTPKSKSGEATGMNTVFRELGMTIAPALGGTYETMYSVRVIIGLIPYRFNGLPFIPITYGFPSATAYNFTYITGIIFLLFAVLLTTLIVEKKGDNNENI